MQDTKYMDEWIRVPLCEKGDKLYHYTMADGVQGIIENGEFLVTKSDFLNDKLEFQHAVEVMGHLTEKYIVNERLRERFFSALKRKIEALGVIAPSCMTDGAHEEEGLSLYVLSFSKLQNNALLWAEFTDFRGYCLEFDYEKLVEGFRNRVCLHGTVLYDEEEQMNGLLESLLTCIHNLVKEGAKDLSGFFEEDANPSDGSLGLLVDEMAVVCSVYAMFFKKNFFAGEEEYRFVFSPLLHRMEEAKPKFRLRDQIFLPYIMVEYECGEDKIPLESVMVGAKNNSDITMRGMRYFLRAQGLDVPVLLSDIPLRY